jgi:hypothetical protein
VSTTVVLVTCASVLSGCKSDSKTTNKNVKTTTPNEPNDPKASTPVSDNGHFEDFTSVDEQKLTPSVKPATEKKEEPQPSVQAPENNQHQSGSGSNSAPVVDPSPPPASSPGADRKPSATPSPNDEPAPPAKTHHIVTGLVITSTSSHRFVDLEVPVSGEEVSIQFVDNHRLVEAVPTVRLKDGVDLIVKVPVIRHDKIEMVPIDFDQAVFDDVKIDCGFWKRWVPYDCDWEKLGDGEHYVELYETEDAIPGCQRTLDHNKDNLTDTPKSDNKNFSSGPAPQLDEPAPVTVSDAPYVTKPLA